MILEEKVYSFELYIFLHDLYTLYFFYILPQLLDEVLVGCFLYFIVFKTKLFF